MKITVIDGTHNKDGMTTKLVDEFIRGAKSANNTLEVLHYDLIKEDIKPCMGCGRCTEDQYSDRGVCNIKGDKGEEIINNCLESDVVVFATPIYEYCVSSTMKRFLERCLPLGKFKFGIVPRRKTSKNKKGIILCVSGAPYPFNFLMGIAIYPKFILTKIAKFLGCGKIDSIFAGGMLINEKIKNKYMKKAFELGKSV